MADTPVAELETYGPDQCAVVSIDDAQRYCRHLTATTCHASRAVCGPAAGMVIRSLTDAQRTHLAAISAFVCWAVSLQRDIDDTDRSLELLNWWQRELDQCLAGEPRHPVFIALSATITQAPLPTDRLRAFLRALKDDRRTPRAKTWQWVASLAERWGGSLAILGMHTMGRPATGEPATHAGHLGAALWLTARWQHVRADAAQLNNHRGRRYLPAEFIEKAIGPNATVADFDDRLCRSAKQGYGVDREMLDQSRQVIRACVERTWPLYDQAASSYSHVDGAVRVSARLAALRGQHMLRKIQLWNYETALHEPALSRAMEWWLAGIARWGR